PQRGGHADPQQPYTGMVQREVIGAQIAQGLSHGVESRSRGSDADGRVGWIELDDVESVGGTVGAHDVGTGSVEVSLGVEAVGRRGHRPLAVDEGPSFPTNFGYEDVDVDVAAADRPGAVGH